LPPPTTLPPRTLPTQPPPPPTTAPPRTTAATVGTTPASVSSSNASDSGSSSAIILIAIGVALFVALVVGLVAARRRPKSKAPAQAMDALLDVSRRLTSAAATGDIDGAIVRDALGLVSATGAALIHQDSDGLRVGHESHEGLLVRENLADGVVKRVAETGQPMMQVSATEAAIRNLPASLIAVPLVGGGRVAAVLVVVRPVASPFQPDDRDTLLALAPVAAAALQNAKTARAAMEETMIDPLTSIGNRRRLSAELPEALRGDQPVALVMVDLDHFKSVNDTHGHPAGDKLLQQVAGVVRDTIRPGDSVYRFGGEEFCVVLRNTSREVSEAVEVAERIRAAVAEREFDVGIGSPLRMTASLGVSTAIDGEVDGDALLARADAALYDAKHGGRNQVCSG